MKPVEFKRIREKLNLSRNEFAKLFGLSGYMAVSNIENGHRNPNKLAIILLLTLDALPAKRANEIIELMRRHGKFE